MPKPLSIAVAGSTAYTRWCAEALTADPECTVTHVLTPEPKRIGRKQMLTENPLHQWANETGTSVTLVADRIGKDIEDQLGAVQRPDFLLVVDFGYFIPLWLLKWPLIHPLNIHPSRLPRWRGSSPGQFSLLYGDEDPAVTLMIMNEEFDAGPILQQLAFSPDSRWTAKEYYDHAFKIITQQLPQLLKQCAAGTLVASEQPAESPTPIARKLSREDGFVSWKLLMRLKQGAQPSDRCEFGEVSSLLVDAFSATGNIYFVVERAIRALSPWPGIWTEVRVNDQEKRLKILSAQLRTAAPDAFTLELTQVQLEGKQPASWAQVNQQIEQ